MTTSLSGTTLTFNDGSTQTTTSTSATVGVGQTWTNVTSSRSLTTVYTNSTGKPIMVAITNNFSSSNALVIRVTLNGVSSDMGAGFNGAAGSPSLCIIIPNGATYSLIYSFWSFGYWFELR
jgi:hypothetical protein